MNLTKETRLEHYKKILEFFETNPLSPATGFCFAIQIEIDSSKQLGDYPELMAYKPNSYSYWFPLDEQGKQKRISILKEIISKMENKNMKKIKSVKLAKDFTDVSRCIIAGTVGKMDYNNLWEFEHNGGIFYASTDEIINCKTGLFHIEYEDEYFELGVPSESELQRMFYANGNVTHKDNLYRQGFAFKTISEYDHFITRLTLLCQYRLERI